MDAARENFIRWYKNPLQTLYNDRDAGFPILMITLPLLERYLREKTGIYEEVGVDKPVFNNALMSMFPGLKNDEAAKLFWKVFRHGLCHQATLRELPQMIFAGLNNDAPEVRSDGRSFIMSPVKFSQRVIEEIENDFDTFEGKSSPQHSLPKIF